MKKFISYHCLLIVLLFSLSAKAQLSLQPFASGFTSPVDIKNVGDARLFIVQKNGYIRIVDTAGTVNPKPFLDIHTLVSTGNEQGLLGLAFSPDYANDKRFYLNYTDLNGDTYISRFLVSSTNPDSAIASSQETILFVDQPEGNHNGGDLHFGTDGYLYCSLGDGGGAGDLHGTIGNGQNLNTYLGKILRINVNVPHGYSIPSDNPFFNNANALDEIWAYGLRNPWRTSFDKLTHDYWIGDVGQNLFEEIDFQPSSSQGGENYGWRCYEANNPYTLTGCGPIANYIFPIYNYAHSGTNGCSITGGYVYRGAKYGAIFGKYFFADYCSGLITSIFPSAVAGWDTTIEGRFTSNDISAFGEDLNGELYVAGVSSGTIKKLTVPDCTPTAFISVEDTIRFCGNSYTLSSPAGAGFTYAWYRNGTGVQQSASNTYTATQNGYYYVQVLSNSFCSANSDSVFLILQNSPAVNFTGLPSFICSNAAAVNLTGIPSGGTFTGNGINGSTFNPLTAGDGSHLITYSYTASSGCTATATNVIAVESCLSVVENNFFNFFKVSPNPGSGRFNLTVNAPRKIKAEIEIQNLFGQVCKKQLIEIQNGENNIQLDLNEFSNGIYFLNLTSSEGAISEKFIVNR